MSNGIQQLPTDEILRICLSHGAEIVQVFGSRARGDARPDSDLDLLIQFREGVSLFDLIRLESELEKLLGIKVEVISKRAIRPEWREQILGEVITIAA